MTATPPDPAADPWRTPPPPSPYGAPSGSGPTGAYGSPAPPQYAPYGQYGGPRPTGTANGLGTAALVLGLLSVLLGIVLVGGLIGILAMILGFIGRSRARRGEATNGGIATGGAVLGFIGVLMSVAIVVVVIGIFAGPINDYRHCVSAANGSSTAQQACGTSLRDRFNSRFNGGG